MLGTRPSIPAASAPPPIATNSAEVIRRPPPMNMPAMARRMPRTRTTGKSGHGGPATPTQPAVESKVNSA